MTNPEDRDPRSRRSTLLSVLGVVLAVLVVVESVVLARLVVASVRTGEAVSEALEGFLDAEIDAGPEAPALDPDDPLLRGRKILLFHDVNARTAKDVCARLMYLDALDPKTPIDLYLSTQGGWTDSAFTIVDTMRLISAPVNAWAIGGCHSSGAMILSAATGRRYASENTILMIHANLDEPDGPRSYDRLEQDRYERIFRETARLPESWYPMTGDKEYYLTPRQALDYGLVDDVVAAREETKTP